MQEIKYKHYLCTINAICDYIKDIIKRDGMNTNKHYYGDSRLNNYCAYCGGPAETEDHVPSRCFLDKPYPQDLPVIPCCHKCNHEFSKDEEYVSCLIDCLKANTAIPCRVQREKTRNTLMHSPKLQERIASQIRDFGGLTIYDYEKDRFEKVIRKLAFGHLAFENDILLCDSTYNISMRLLLEMSDSQRYTFFQPYNGTLLPEVCSHGLEHVVLHYEDGGVHSFSSFWNTVQEGRYSYCASPDGNKVKFVVADYLAVEVCINMAV